MDDPTAASRSALQEGAPRKGKIACAAAAVAVAVVVALAGGMAGRGEPRPPTGAAPEVRRVAVISIEGIGPADFSDLGLARRLGRLSTDAPTAYGLIRRAPLAGSDAVWAEAMTGLFAAGKPGFRIGGEKRLWERLATGDGTAVVLAASGPAPVFASDGERASIPAGDRERLEKAIVAWRNPGNRLVALKLDCAAAERLNGKDLSETCRSLVIECIAKLVEDPGEDGTVLVFSSAAPVAGPTSSGSGTGDSPPIYLGPGLVLGSGRGIGSRRWPAIARLADVSPTTLYLLGLRVPTNLDGVVLSDIVDPSFLFHNPVRYGEG